MIGLWGVHSAVFLRIASALTLALGAPMFFWPIPNDTDLAVYFGRCLGGVISILAIMGFVAASRPQLQPFYFTLMLATVGVSIVAHIWGTVRKIQPLSETVKIAVWVLLFILGLLFHP